MDLTDRHVFLTGGSRGIGLAVATALAGRGARVFVAALADDDERRAACAQIDPAGERSAATYVDVTDAGSIAAGLAEALRTFGDIDVLVNNAGLAVQGLVVDLDLALVERELRTNYLGTYLTSKLALPAMIARRSGVIVNVASTLAPVPGPTLANYSASKAAIVAFSSALRSEVEDDGVDVRVFIPGLTDTGLTGALFIDTGTLSTTDEVAADFLRALDGDEPVYVCGEINRMVVDLAHTDPEGARSLMKASVLPQFRTAAEPKEPS